MRVHQTQILQQRQVIAQLIVNATRDIQEMTVRIAMGVCLANTRAMSAAVPAKIVSLELIPVYGIVSRQVCVRHVHQNRTLQQRQVIAQLIVNATRDIQEMTLRIAMRVCLANTRAISKTPAVWAARPTRSRRQLARPSPTVAATLGGTVPTAARVLSARLARTSQVLGDLCK